MGLSPCPPHSPVLSFVSRGRWRDTAWEGRAASLAPAVPSSSRYERGGHPARLCLSSTQSAWPLGELTAHPGSSDHLTVVPRPEMTPRGLHVSSLSPAEPQLPSALAGPCPRVFPAHPPSSEPSKCSTIQGAASTPSPSRSDPWKGPHPSAGLFFLSPRIPFTFLPALESLQAELQHSLC